MTLLQAQGLAKRYGSIVALRSVDLSVAPGEVHALLGANGAGKSTVVKVLTGVVRPDEGSIVFGGEPVRISSPASARSIGIASVFQDSALVPDLTVAQNVRLTRTDLKAVSGWLEQLGMTVDLGEQVGQLPLSTVRMLDLAAALARDPQLLVLDELTAALPGDLADRVFAVVRTHRQQGRSALFITHRLAEVVALCDRATVLRDGATIETLVPKDVGTGRIVEAMLGEAPDEVDRPAAAGIRGSLGTPTEVQPSGAPPALEVSELRLGHVLNGATFSLRKGEILGVAALEGQGQECLFECLAGLRHPDAGEIRVEGRPLKARTPLDAISAGLVLVPGDRTEALLPQRSVRENIASPRYNRFSRWGPINLRGERSKVADAVARLKIDVRAQREVRRLSGGNQQKVAIGRWLAAGFMTILCFDPTRGIDVGAKREIYGLLRELADEGRSVLLFTSELTEISLACDRVVVLYRGEVVSEMLADQATEVALLRAAHGLAHEAVAV